MKWVDSIEGICKVYFIFVKMNDDEQRKYLEDIVQGNVIEGRNDIATTTRNYLCQRFKASNVAERKFEHFQQIKKEQANIIDTLSNTNS